MIRVHHAVDDGVDRFVAVAEVDTFELGEAAAITRHFGCRPWTVRRRVRHLRTAPERSTSPGDILERDSCFFLVASVGFIRVAGLDNPTPVPGGRLTALLAARPAPEPELPPFPRSFLDSIRVEWTRWVTSISRCG